MDAKPKSRWHRWLPLVLAVLVVSVGSERARFAKLAKTVFARVPPTDTKPLPPDVIVRRAILEACRKYPPVRNPSFYEESLAAEAAARAQHDADLPICEDAQH
jgi:hypothetical protein